MQLLAGLVVLTWRTAYREALRIFERGGSAKKVDAAFVALIEHGFSALETLTSSTGKRPPQRRAPAP
jgi:hypothetical protein